MAQEAIRAGAELVAVGLASRWTLLRMCGSGGGEGEKAVDKFVEGKRLEDYSTGLSISSTKSYFWLSDSFSAVVPSSASRPPALCCPVPSVPWGWEDKGSSARQPVPMGVQLCWGSPLPAAWEIIKGEC